MIKGVIFDMDGVMIDTERQSNLGWLHAGEVIGEEIPMWLIDSFKGAPNQLSKSFFDDYFKGRHDYQKTKDIRTQFVLELREKEGTPIKKGLFELLDFIKDNQIKCAVATSTRRASAEDILHRIGAYPYLNAIVYGDSVEHGKPEPDIFLKAAETIDVPVSECIVIEDSINGIKAGYAANIKVIHVPDTIKIDDPTKRLVYQICNDLTEVIAVIKDLNATEN